MTREEARLYADKHMGIYGGKLVDEVVQTIYDDFESRTCENCKFYNERSLKRYRGACGLFKFMIPLEFKYCNKFEAKDD